MRWQTVLAGSLLWAILAVPAWSEVAKESESCLECHGSEGMSMTLPGGEELSVTVDREVYGKSVHGSMLACTDCHADISEYPHPERKLETRREYTLALYEACKQCHFEHYTRSLESIHYKMVSQGDKNAPVCVDCHGAHDITKPGQPRNRISQTCARCHAAVSEAYSNSVHGKASAQADNPDVPVCTDCHAAHSMEDPRTRSFGMKTPELCGNCHADPERMKKYGLSTKVVDTYLQDFHGVTIKFQKSDDAPPAQESLQPVCTDCHGVHDIARTDDPDSAVMKANLVQTCRKCHPDATESFPNAWLGHYEPTWSKAPLVCAINLFYGLFIPFLVIGLLVQIVLHVWRVAINR